MMTQIPLPPLCLSIPYLFCLFTFVGCVSSLSFLDDGGTELVRGELYDFDQRQATSRKDLSLPTVAYRGMARIYQYTLLKPRFIRFMYIETLGNPIKNVDIYAQRNTDRWILVKQFKSYVDMSTRIYLNVRASKIYVVQKTVSTRRQPDDLVIGLKVYAQKGD